jgi:hypothetical protein
MVGVAHPRCAHAYTNFIVLWRSHLGVIDDEPSMVVADGSQR